MGWCWLIFLTVIVNSQDGLMLPKIVRIDSQRCNCHSVPLPLQPVATLMFQNCRSYVDLADGNKPRSWWCFWDTMWLHKVNPNMPRPGVEGQILPDRWVSAAAPRECVVEALAPTVWQPLHGHSSCIFFSSELGQVEVNLQTLKPTSWATLLPPLPGFFRSKRITWGYGYYIYIHRHMYTYKWASTSPWFFKHWLITNL